MTWLLSIHPGPSNARQRAGLRGDPANLELQARSSVPSPFRREGRPLCPHATSVTLIPLLPPGVAVIVVAEAFPKARLILVHQCNAPHPFGALPEVKMGDKKTCRAAVFRRKIFVVESKRDPSLLVRDVFKGQICGVVTVGMRQNILGIGF